MCTRRSQTRMQGAGHGFASEYLPSPLCPTYCDLIHAHVHTELHLGETTKEFISQNKYIQDHDDIAGSAFHLDRWALLNLANSLFRSIST